MAGSDHYRACARRLTEEYIMLVRWDPFEEMNRLHDHFWSGRGLSKRAFQVAVDIREEDVSGERKVEKEEIEDTYRRVERQYGSFTRSFTLPETVDTENISADLKDGVLALRLPKKNAPTPRSISVNATK
jgi:hypothetical protein